MCVDLRPIGEENRADALALSVAPGQEGMIETTAQCLAEADADARWKPTGIYVDGEMVGFAMYGSFSTPREGRERLWLDRLLIDGRHQGKGYGAKALTALLTHMCAEYRADTIYLSVYSDNAAAIALYTKKGFAFNGEKDRNGELVMVWRETRVLGG